MKKDISKKIIVGIIAYVVIALISAGLIHGLSLNIWWCRHARWPMCYYTLWQSIGMGAFSALGFPLVFGFRALWHSAEAEVEAARAAAKDEE